MESATESISIHFFSLYNRHNQELYHGSTYGKNKELSSKIRKETNTLFINNQELLNYLKIINDYSKSLAFAPIKSEEYALALSNKASVLMKILKFEESIVDIEEALKITQDSTIIFKLICKKIECLKNLNRKSEIKQYHNEALNISLSLGEHKDSCIKKLNSILQKDVNFQIQRGNKDIVKVSNFISQAISWSYNEKYGNHLLANEDIKVGDKIIIENFYCAYPAYDNLYIVCANCINLTVNCTPCDFCAHAVFCSKKCKEQGWENFHEIECDLYKNFLIFPKLSPFQMAVRFFIIAVKENKDLTTLITKAKKLDSTDKKESIFSNLSIKQSQKTFEFVYGLKKIRFDFGNKSNLLRIYENFLDASFSSLKQSKFFSKKEIMDNSDAIKNILLNLAYICNSNYVRKEVVCSVKTLRDLKTDVLSAGGIISPVFSLINHSCIPNCSYIFTENFQCVTYACRPIKKNEQLFISYVNDEEFQNRQEKFLQNYHMLCDCLLCKNNDWTKLSLPTDQNHLKLQYNDIYNFFNSFQLFSTMEFKSKFGNESKKKQKQILCNFIQQGYSTLSLKDAELALKKFGVLLQVFLNAIYGVIYQ